MNRIDLFGLGSKGNSCGSRIRGNSFGFCTETPLIADKSENEADKALRKRLETAKRVASKTNTAVGIGEGAAEVARGTATEAASAALSKGQEAGFKAAEKMAGKVVRAMGPAGKVVTAGQAGLQAATGDVKGAAVTVTGGAATSGIAGAVGVGAAVLTSSNPVGWIAGGATMLVMAVSGADDAIGEAVVDTFVFEPPPGYTGCDWCINAL